VKDRDIGELAEVAMHVQLLKKAKHRDNGELAHAE
jgi:hypothetical protein